MGITGTTVNQIGMIYAIWNEAEQGWRRPGGGFTGCYSLAEKFKTDDIQKPELLEHERCAILVIGLNDTECLPKGSLFKDDLEDEPTLPGEDEPLEHGNQSQSHWVVAGE